MKAVKSARRRYSEEFKVQAVKLSRDPHMQTKDVAAALAIHPFMLTRWKKEYREGRLRDRRGSTVELAKRKVREHLRVVQLERELEALRIENDLLKKAIQFDLARRRRSSGS
jgi:transposase